MMMGAGVCCAIVVTFGENSFFLLYNDGSAVVCRCYYVVDIYRVLIIKINLIRLLVVCYFVAGAFEDKEVVGVKGRECEDQ